MYPIEREDYVNAYIGAMTEEINKAKLLDSVQPESSGAVDRLYRAVADKLSGWRGTTRSTTTPVPTA